jgi:hypothetical protein
MGQVIIEGEGSEALPRQPTTYPLTRKKEMDYMIHTAHQSYMNPYNEAVGGQLCIQYALAKPTKKTVRAGPAGGPEGPKKSVREARPPHISGPQVDLGYCEIASVREIAARAREVGVRRWTAAEMKTIRIIRPQLPRPRRGAASSQRVEIQEPEPEPEPEPGRGSRASSASPPSSRRGDGAAAINSNVDDGVAANVSGVAEEVSKSLGSGALGGASRLGGGAGSWQSATTARSSQGSRGGGPKASSNPKLKAVVQDAFMRIFESVSREKSTLTSFFHQMDQDGDGSVDGGEFVAALATLGVRLTRSEMRLCMAELDVNGDGTVDSREFLSRMNEVRRRQLQGKDSASWQPDAAPEDPIEVRQPDPTH